MKIRFFRVVPGAVSMALLTSTLAAVALLPGAAQRSLDAAQADARAARTPRPSAVYVAGDLADEDLIALSTAVIGGERPGVLLLDSPKLTSQWKDFLKGQRP